MDALLESLAAKQAITEVLHRYCRAMDRMDRDLALACWHPGGMDDHSPNYTGDAAGFIDWVWPVHAALVATRHETSNILIDLQGDQAGVESYCAITLRVKREGETYDVFTSGRYLDRFERLDGVWAIRHRQSISEWHRVERLGLTVTAFQTPPLLGGDPIGGRPLRPRRDRTDPSYDFLP
jgi:hypothetical protein